jgi:dipeptidase E
MKLYLSSYGVGNEPEKLAGLVGPNKRTALIMNAIDGIDPAEYTIRVHRESAAIESLGLVPTVFDLRDYFEKPREIEDALSEYGLLWIRGGNVFVLRKAMALSGFDKIIRNLLNKGIVYAGYSAASCAAGPTLHGVELCDDINRVPEGYPSETIWEGLNLIDYVIAPHFKSDHPESLMIDDVVKYLEEHDTPFKTLHDGEVIIINE